MSNGNKEIVKDVKQIPEKPQEKIFNPAKDNNNYFIIIRNKQGQIMKQLICNNATVEIGLVGEQSILTELK